VVTLVLASRLSVLGVLHNSCNISTLSLLEMYFHSPWALTMSAHVTTIKLMFSIIYSPCSDVVLLLALTVLAPGIRRFGKCKRSHLP